MLNKALAEKGADTPVSFPNTAYFLPTILGMTGRQVEKIGDQIAIVLTEEALEVLNTEVGGVLHLEPAKDGGAVAAVTKEVWVDDPHARGRAFLKRYNRTFERL